jgi:XTP/dITP diphosphohydrolase
MNTRETQLEAFDRLLGIMEELREKCPWDKKTNASNVTPSYH